VVFATSNNLVASYVGKLIEFQNCEFIFWQNIWIMQRLH